MIEAGLTRRLDLQTVRDREADAQRRLAIARSQVRPDLSVFGEGKLENSGAEDAETDEQFTAGVSLELPLDRRDERDAVMRAELDLAEAERALAQKTDEVRLEVMDGMTQMRFLANSVRIEAENINIAERRAESALIRFRNGELLNRDVVEAENELLAARNAYVRLQARYEIQRIRLLRNTGLLDVAADGVLVELEVTE